MIGHNLTLTRGFRKFPESYTAPVGKQAEELHAQVVGGMAVDTSVFAAVKSEESCTERGTVSHFVDADANMAQGEEKMQPCFSIKTDKTASLISKETAPLQTSHGAVVAFLEVEIKLGGVPGTARPNLGGVPGFVTSASRSASLLGCPSNVHSPKRPAKEP